MYRSGGWGNSGIAPEPKTPDRSEIAVVDLVYTGNVSDLDTNDSRTAAVVEALRTAGAQFALVFGSSARGDARAESDLDVAAWWPSTPPHPWDIELPAGVDLIAITHHMPLELAGRIAQEGVVLFEDDTAARVEWVATTRKIWLDERYRFERSNREFLEAVARGR